MSLLRMLVNPVYQKLQKKKFINELSLKLQARIGKKHAKKETILFGTSLSYRLSSIVANC